MLKSYFLRCFLLALFLCLGAANVPGQEPLMIPPPIPTILPPEPPEPDALPSPPQLQWSPLPPRDSATEVGPPPVTGVAAPQAETALAPPPPPVIETPLSVTPDPAEGELAKPVVEIWRDESEWPQIPGRRPHQLDQAYITGTDPVVLRVQFNPQAAGKNVIVRPGRGVDLGTSSRVLTIASNGECILSAQLDQIYPRGHIIFYCEGVKTVLPLARASLQKVEENEAETGGDNEKSIYSYPGGAVLFCAGNKGPGGVDT